MSWLGLTTSDGAPRHGAILRLPQSKQREARHKADAKRDVTRKEAEAEKARAGAEARRPNSEAISTDTSARRS